MTDRELAEQIEAFLADAPQGKPHTGYRYGELLAFAAARLRQIAEAEPGQFPIARLKIEDDPDNPHGEIVTATLYAPGLPVGEHDVYCAAAPVPDPYFIGLAHTLLAALKRLSFAAQTACGTAGRDNELVTAIGQAESAIKEAHGRTPAAPAPDADTVKDAQRYRFAKTMEGQVLTIDVFRNRGADELDAAIDAAMEQK